MMTAQTLDFAPQMTTIERLTLFDLVTAVQDAAENDAEVIATLRHMAETGRFHLGSADFDDLPWAA